MLLLTQDIYSQITIDTNQVTTIFKVMDNDSSKAHFVKDTIERSTIVLGSDDYTARFQKNENISFPRLGIGDTFPNFHSLRAPFKIKTYSTVYTKYLKVAGNEYTYEEGIFLFRHDVEKDLFTINVDGKPYLNFHANLFGRREGRSIYMVNPNSFVEYNDEYLKFESDDEDTLIFFYR